MTRSPPPRMPVEDAAVAVKVKTALGAHAGRAILAAEPWQDSAPTFHE